MRFFVLRPIFLRLETFRNHSEPFCPFQALDYLIDVFQNRVVNDDIVEFGWPNQVYVNDKHGENSIEEAVELADAVAVDNYEEHLIITTEALEKAERSGWRVERWPSWDRTLPTHADFRIKCKGYEFNLPL